MGCICNAGGSVKQVFDSLIANRRSPVFSDRIRSTLPVRYPVLELPEAIAPSGFLDTPEARRCGLLVNAAIIQALSDAGLSIDDLKDKRVGIVLGSTVGNAMNNEEFYAEYLKGQNPPMDAIDTYLMSSPTDMAADMLGIKCLRYCVSNACASGAVAIGQGARLLKSGQCDIIIAGGVDILCRVVYNGFISLKIYDEGFCRPFDANRKGLNLGEGAGIVIMESCSSVEKRNIVPQGYICGYGNYNDAFHMSAPSPDASGLRKATEFAMAAGKVNFQDIAFINAHGTATPENDKVEGSFISSLPGEIPFQSTKGYTGHTLGAAGAIEAIISIVQLNNSIIAATAGFEVSDEAFDRDPVAENTPVTGDYALSNSLAFGGNNAVLLLRKGGR